MSRVFGGIMGLCVGDALGVPVEFAARESLIKTPVIGMRGFGTYEQPAGTWSDDTSMTLCLAESLTKGLDYTDIMMNFMAWIDEAKFTATDEIFDIGSATRKALIRFAKGSAALKCGGESEHDNGNGSLMRILPLAYYLYSKYKADWCSEEGMGIVHNVSSLTHAHKRSQIACGIYIAIAVRLIEGAALADGIREGVEKAAEYYKSKPDFVKEFVHYRRLSDPEFKMSDASKIKSTGYVVDTLEAAIWCLLNTNNYRECVLKAVNLGVDTDTVAAVAGGLAGIYYGKEEIPLEWLSQIVRREYVEEICTAFEVSLKAVR